MEELGLCHVQCILLLMRPNRLISTVLFLLGVMSITGGCTTDAVEPSKQLKLSSTPPLLEKDTTSYTDKVVDTLGGYYDEIVSFLTDDCGVGSDLGLAVGVKNAYDGFKEDTAGCSS